MDSIPSSLTFKSCQAPILHAKYTAKMNQDRVVSGNSGIKYSFLVYAKAEAMLSAFPSRNLCGCALGKD